ncbi:OmpA family protein [Tamlana sp. s12]|uniref:OmpA family protein n=1 Tax=Tamlana sp. s12 TaxID=1630406 RepID=UPI0008007AF2|nr:OmpA family protein [Tamlana sp. s12]OBQ51803.1 flagellar motor protein MotB [Tamlana sp. s12]QQY81513.1 OmpA family protein [Tamlana sp. s12]
MKNKSYIFLYITLLISFSVFSQQGKQNKADTLFNKFSFVKASKLYQELIQNNYNRDYATRKIADCYALLRDPRNANRYYKSVVKQDDVPVEYYYKYAQSLRGMKKYKESEIWLQRYIDSGGVPGDNDFTKNVNFISSVFGAKQQYFLDKVRFNSKYSDFGAFEHQGQVYFASSRDQGVLTKRVYGWNEQPFLDVYVAKAGTRRNVDHGAKVPGDVNSIYHDGPVTITKDGKTMYFSRNNFAKGVERKDAKGITNMKIYRAHLVDGQWTNLEDLEINSDDFSTQHAALNSDDTKLYFASDRPGTYGGSDIWVANINPDGSITDVQNMGNIVNTEKSEGFPFINNEGILFFSSDGHVGLGLMDIFATLKDDDYSIIDIINLGIPVNSSTDDFAFTMNANGITGYFASNRRGGRGSDDIYAYHREPVLHIEGEVIDAINMNPIEGAKITLYDANDKEIAYMLTDENGYYQINIDRNKDYKIVATQDKYIEDYRKFTSKNIQTELITVHTNLLLNPKHDVIKLAELQTIYFDYDRFNIREDAAMELDKIVNLMLNDYPEMVIRIESYTDSRGSLSYNEKLSIDRANATYNYLVSHGIDASRIVAHDGLGEGQLTNGCENDTECEEKEHQLNRRTQFIVVKME